MGSDYDGSSSSSSKKKPTNNNDSWLLSIRRLLLLLRHQWRRLWLYYYNFPRKTIIFIIIITLPVFLLPSPEMVYTETFTREDYYESTSLLPKQCINLAKRFDKCQQNNNKNTNNIITIILACHRKWCNSYYGHCEPCAGLGDRIRFLLSQIQDIDTKINNNNECNAKVYIDYANTALATLQSVIYHDPTSWFGEILHYRSYDVTNRIPLDYDNLLIKNNNNDNTFYYSHFTPNNYKLNVNYNPCYFYILFQPTILLQLQIRKHLYNMKQIVLKDDNNNNNNDNNNDNIITIGIHYRTGDQLAFHIQNNDTRIITGNNDHRRNLDDTNTILIDGWNKLLQCATKFVHETYPNESNNDNNIVYFLATDNPYIKQYVQNNYNNHNNINIYTTNIIPGSYLRGNMNDIDAWLEIFLLSKCNILIANTLPNKYYGTAKQFSQFILLAQKIGFILTLHGCSIT